MIRVLLKDGSEVALSEDEGRRVLYALATLAQTPVGPEINVCRVVGADGTELWPCSE